MVSSLNATLARLSAIESNFKAIEGYSNRITQNYAMKNYGSIDMPKEAQSESFNQILDTKDKVEKKTEEVFEQAIDMLGAQDKQIKAQLLDKFEYIKPAEAIKGKIKKIQTPEVVEKLTKSKLRNIDEIISSTSQKYGVDENFVRAIIKQESGFNPNAKSKSGAMGLMQLMPKTAHGLGIADAFNPEQNVDGGVRYIKDLIEKYDGEKKIALAAYNAGPTAVKRYGGIPPYKETQNYVKNVMAIYEKSNEVSLWLQKELEQ